MDDDDDDIIIVKVVISAIFRWAKVISEIAYHFQSTNQFAER